MGAKGAVLGQLRRIQQQLWERGSQAVMLTVAERVRRVRVCMKRVSMRGVGVRERRVRKRSGRARRGRERTGSTISSAKHHSLLSLSPPPHPAHTIQTTTC